MADLTFHVGDKSAPSTNDASAFTEEQFTIPISGTAMGVITGSEIYYDAVKYDGGTPGAYSALAALHDAHPIKRGKGTSWRVRVDRAGAETIQEYCWTVGSGFAGETDPETKADGRALLKVSDKIKGLLA